MAENNWSHPVMIKLGAGCLQLSGKAWLHSSQIAGLRHAKLSNPGPRAFVGIERLNYYLYRYRDEKLLLPGSRSANDYADAQPILENGLPPELGWWVEIFCGYRVPKDLDLDAPHFSEANATKISQEWGKLARRLLTTKGYDIVTDLNRACENHYLVQSQTRLRKFKDVLFNKEAWTAEELQIELPTLTQFSASLGGPASEEDLFKTLQN